MKPISISDAANLFAVANRGTFALIDVRERWEYTQGHISHATPLPRGLMEIRMPVVVPNKQAIVVLYSETMDRAILAAKTLSDMGYHDVRVLEGGLTAWKAAGHEAVGGWSVDGKHLGELFVQEYPDIQIHSNELEQVLATEKVRIIDIRTAWEHEQGCIPGAVHIPAGELFLYADALKMEMKQGKWDRIVTHCSGRTRGIAAATLLRSQGVNNVYALENGCMGWILSGHTMAFGETPAFREEISPLSAWGSSSYSDNAELPISELKWLAHGRCPSCYVVDVRLGADYLAGHIPGSISIPAGQVMLEFENYLGLRGLPVVVVAESAAQGAWVAANLRRVGFPVTVMTGGFGAWSAAGLPVATGVEPNEAVSLMAARQAQGAIRTVEPEVVSATMDDWLVIDVRSIGEWGINHIPGALDMPRGQIESKLAQSDAHSASGASCRIDGGKSILLVSETGTRASFAYTLVAEHPRLAGRISVLHGGLRAWHAAGLPLEEGNLPTEKSTHDTVAKVTRSQWQRPAGDNRASMQEYLDWEEKLGHKN